MMTTTEGNAVQPRRVCFSFAAYSKVVIEHLRACGIPVADGLSEEEFAVIESSHGFQFPPDLRSILREGLPIGAGFPNWRSASPQQIQILLSLPASSLLYEISRPSGGRFWPVAWGPRPESSSDSNYRARLLLARAPKLVPVYRHYYIAASPNLAGNPLFFVRGSDVRCCGYDLADFFARGELSFTSTASPAPTPSWMAREARTVEVWTELAEGGGGGCGGWLKAWMRRLGWRLLEGGWGEEDVREMLLMGRWNDETKADPMEPKDPLDVVWHVRLLALVLLRAGWSAEDVVYSMGGKGFADGRMSAATGACCAEATKNEISSHVRSN
ncbi:hypothetical protein HPP92_022184 [Vanilla planifolia]|uniref:Uncharacterized protein n=1 Tax=Vanilla planifolia TaxID=51239 RepID=A0A835UH01_VANPL|nr:hypothetical protein HPP92_022184 [Vanilla planifolia]